MPLHEHFNPKSANNYEFKFNFTGSLIKKYREKLEVSLLNKDASILVLKIRDYNVGKGVDFLNKLTEVFQFDNLLKERKRQPDNPVYQLNCKTFPILRAFPKPGLNSSKRTSAA